MANKLISIAAIVSLLCIQALVKAQDDGSVLVKQLISEAARLGYQIDNSQINVTTVEGNSVVASVPLTQKQELRVTSDQLAKGQVYLSIQCMKTQALSGCYRVRATGLVQKGTALGVSLVDAGGKTVASSTVTLSQGSGSTGTVPSSARTIIIRGPVRVYIDGQYVGTYDWVIIRF